MHLAALFLLALASASASSVCDFGSFLFGLDTVAGLPSGLNYTANGVNIQREVTDELQKAFLSGGAGKARERFFSVCSAKERMFQQMKPSNIRNCIDATTFLLHGLSASTAYTLKKFFERISYQCGPAFTTYMTNMEKFMFASTNLTASFKACSKAYLKGIQTTDETVYCKAMQDYSLCQANVFLTASNNVELAYSTCEATRIGEVVTLPLCSTSVYFCSVELIQQQN
ncbi:hypothetical protein QR680_005718 [Steinernema hermaphroditum]|uniref:DUF19 domain-containing protein n=1 Tax=Steinernema hermaphroditum TaxID=289476 RepID=A0AA39HT45_9BILA|nr:hypothetical protein QR680_005718 [Steinernema hermaphroditum]